MRIFSHHLSPAQFLTIGDYEKEAEFRDLLQSIAKKGLFIYGLLAVISLAFYVISHLLFYEKAIVWDFTVPITEAHLLMIDKVLIFLFSCILIYLSRSSFSLKKMRTTVFFVIWFISIAMLLEDIARQDASFTSGYITLALFFSVVMVPFKGWHTAILSITVLISTLVALAYLPLLMGMDSLTLDLGQRIFVFIVGLLLTGTSSQIYINRYEQFHARKRAEELGRALEDRAEVLQQLKEKSDRQAEQLRENEKLKDQFFANISHEFRTPLTLILGPLKDLTEETGEQENSIGASLKEKLLLMQRNAQKLLVLINQLLDLSKMDSGKIYLNKQLVDIRAFAAHIVSAFSTEAERRDVSLSLYPDDYNPVAEVDEELMEQAIGNLISNALKFTSAGGKVTVSVRQESANGNHVYVSVKDTGIGIPDKERAHIFDRFYQVSHGPSDNRQGTGIGLAFTKEVVELHGGSILVRSKMDKGSEFEITLPVSSDSHAQEAVMLHLPDSKSRKRVYVHEQRWDEELRIEQPKEGSSDIVVVDDNPDILAYLEPHLSQRYGLFLFSNSQKALEFIREKKVDLVITDIMMPDPDGFEVCQAIKENESLNHIPVIMLTARVAEESKIEGLELGADDYISKPFSASELMVRVENLIELRNMLREKYSQQVRIKGREVEVSSDDARFLQEVQAAIEAHMANSNFGVDWLADEVNLSSRQLQRKIRSITNLSAGGYIRLLRLERAGQLLEQHWGNVSEIAYEVGFQDARYFSKLFKQTYGSTPSDYVANLD